MRSSGLGQLFPLLVLFTGCAGDDASPANHPMMSNGGTGTGTGTGGSGATAGSTAASGGGTGGANSGGAGASGTTPVFTGGASFNGDSYDCPAAAGPTGPVPALTAGTWTQLTPKDAGVGNNATLVFANCMGVDPCNPNVIYTCTSGYNAAASTNADGGIWKSTDAGATWSRMGHGVIDSPAGMAIGPNGHVYVNDGVRGSTLGFWRSRDGGMTWEQPPGFKAATSDPTVGNNDVSSIAVDPHDFRHVLVGFHGGWTDHGTYTNRAGLFESTDGGDSFKIHYPPMQWGAGSQGVSFLFNPKLGIGDKDTWLVALDSLGFWRTPDAGTTWTQVSTISAGHGGNEVYYSTKTKVLYAGATPNLARSADNGLTWTAVTQGVPGSYYFSVIGDGTTLYTMPDYNNGTMQSFISSPEGDGATWTAYPGVMLTRGPFKMAFDSVNRIVYSANWDAGVWALKAP